jgi:ketosteroid isomerase-like protein
MPVQDPIDVARAIYLAYANKDRRAIEALIADDFRFTSPLDNRLDRETYFVRCWPNSENIDDYQFIHLVPHQDRVFVTYEAISKRNGQFRNTEVLTIRNGRVVAAEVYFGWSIPHQARDGGFIEPEQ